jgi:hypothetical protein
MADGSVKINVGLSMNKAERDLAKLKEKIMKAEDALNANSARKTELEKRLEELGNTAEASRKKIQRLREEYNNSRGGERASIKAQLDRYTGNYNSTVKDIDALSREYQKVDENIEKGTKDLEEMKQQAGAMVQQIEAARPGEALASSIETARKSLAKFLKYSLGIRSVYIMFQRLKSWVKGTFDQYVQYDNELKHNIDLLDATKRATRAAIGSGLATIYAAMLPTIQRIANWTLEAANAAAKFIAILSGKSTYKRAVVSTGEISDNMDDTAASAKETRKQLMSFDELNLLGDSGSGISRSAAKSRTASDGINMIEEKIDSADDSKLARVGRALADLIERLKQLLRGDIGIKDFIGGLDGLQTALATIIGTGLLMMFISLVSKIPVIGTAAAGVLTLLTQGMLLMAETFTLVYGAIKISDAVEGYKAASEAYENEIDTALTNYEKLYKEKGKDVADQWAKMVYQIDTSGLTLAQAQEKLTERITELWGDAPKNCKEGWIQGWNHYFGKDGVGLWQLIEDAFTGLINFVKEILGIHSPSSVFSDIARDCVQGLWNGWQEKWNAFITYMQGRWTALKNWWSGLSLEGFRIKTPHLSWSTKQASGWIASTLSALGLPSAIPQLSVQWYARGGIFDRASLIGVGEAGKEAVVPLENNTGWMQMVADGLMERMEQSRFAEQLAEAFVTVPRPVMASGTVAPPRAVTDYSPSAGIEDAVRRGVFDALSITSSGGQGEERQPINVYIGDDKIASYILRVNNRNSLITGGR